MLKVRAGDRAVFGIPPKLIEQFMDGRPMLIELSALHPDTKHILIFYGESDAKLKQALAHCGLQMVEKGS
jgi:hypothetical protein